MKKITCFIGCFLIITAFSFQPNDKEKINWISMQQLNEQYAKEPRPILIDIYTDWCGWCKEMDRTTYKHEKLATYINERYYAVKYNAESKEDISFNNKAFHYNSQYRTNELAIYLTGGQLSYPTTVFLSASNAQPAAPARLYETEANGRPAEIFR